MNLLEQAQYGFHNGRSCEDQVYNLTSILKHILLDDKDTLAACIDMPKAGRSSMEACHKIFLSQNYSCMLQHTAAYKGYP